LFRHLLNPFDRLPPELEDRGRIAAIRLQAMDEGSTSESDAEPEALDTAALDSLAEQLGEDIDGLLERFERRLTETVPAIDQSLTADDRAELSRHAHSLKSVAATFGADAVARSSAKLEACAGGADPAELNAAVDRLSCDCVEARDAVAGWLAQRPGA
jgi:HPt (histidine-containing phosphotransfer) domain-containing protein